MDPVSNFFLNFLFPIFKRFQIHNKLVVSVQGVQDVMFELLILIKKYVGSLFVMSKNVGAAVVSFDNTVKMFEFIIEFVNAFNKGKDVVKGFKLID